MVKNNLKSLIVILGIIGALMIGIIYYHYQYPNTQNRIFGVTYMTMNNPFYEVINNELLKAIEDNGDQLLVRDPALDVDKQIEQIYSFIDYHVDGIFINPIDSEKITPALEAAHQAGIPVIVVDAPVKNEELVNCTIVSDNYDAGVQCANDMMKRFDSARIVLLKHTNVKSAKDRILQRQSNIDVVMALNDPSALGALAALEAHHQENTVVYGVDGTPDMKTLIGGHAMIAGTVAQSPISIGHLAAEKMYEYLVGKDIENEVVIPVQLINEDNIEMYDETGWQ